MARKHAHIYSDPRWKQIVAQVYEEEENCRICGRYCDPRYPARTSMSRSVHHLVDLDLGGAPFDRDNAGLAHYGCNSRLGAEQAARTREARRGPAPQVMRGMRVHVRASEV